MSRSSYDPPDKLSQSNSRDHSFSILKLPHGLLSCFRYATSADIFLFAINLIFIFCSGACFPAFSWALSSFIQLLSTWQDHPANQDDFATLLLFLLSTVLGVIASFMLSSIIMNFLAGRQVAVFKQKYLEVLVSDALTGVDPLTDPRKVSSQLEEDCSFLLDTLGQKLTIFAWTISTITISVGVALFRGWQLSIISLILCPLAYLAFQRFKDAISDPQPQFSKLYTNADLVVKEALHNIKAVVGLGGEYREIQRYREKLTELEGKIESHFIVQALALGGTSILFYIGFALAIYAGVMFMKTNVVNLSTGDAYTLSDIICITLCIYICIPVMHFAAPAVSGFPKAKRILARLLSVIETGPALPYDNGNRRRSLGLTSKANTTASNQGATTASTGRSEFTFNKSPGPYDINAKLLSGDNGGVFGKLACPGQLFSKKSEKVVFNNVTVLFPGRRNSPVLSNLSLEVKPNSITVFVIKDAEPQTWANTFFKVIQGARDPERGTIVIGNNELQNLSQDWVRAQVMEIAEEPLILPVSLRENMTLMKPGLSDDEIFRRIETIDSDGLFAPFRKKLSAVIGVNGNELSSEEKQIVGLIRAILGDPSVLLVHDKMLEGMNAKRIGKILHKMSFTKTVIMACRSLRPIKGAEKVLLVEQGIVEEIEMPEYQSFRQEPRGTWQSDELLLKGLNGTNESSSRLSLSSSRRSSYAAAAGLDIRVDSIDEEQQSFVEKINEQDLLELNEALGSYEDTISVSPGPDAVEEHSERLWQLVQTEVGTFLLALLPALANSVLVPLAITLLAKLVALCVPRSELIYMKRINQIFGELIILGLIILSCYLVGVSRLLWFRLKVSNILRRETFARVLRMHIAWHEEPENSPDIIAQRLKDDATRASTAISLNQSLTTQLILNLSIAVIMAIFANVQLGLITLCFVLGLAIISIFLDIFKKKSQGQYKASLVTNSQFISQALYDTITIQRLPNRQRDFFSMIHKLTDQSHWAYKKICVFSDIFTAFVCVAIFANTALLSTKGILLHLEDELSIEMLLICVFVPIFSVFELIKFFFLLTDSNATSEASENIFKYFDSKSQIDIEDRKLAYKGEITGEVEFRNVVFKYPGYDLPTLKGVNFKVKASSQIVILGDSRSGREAIGQLLLRFYDVESGEILLDGVNIKNYNLHHLRKNVGVIFDRSQNFISPLEYNNRCIQDYLKGIEGRDSIQKGDFSGIKEEQWGRASLFSELPATNDQSSQWSEVYEILDVNEESVPLSQKHRKSIARTLQRKPNIFVFEAFEGKSEKGHLEIREIMGKFPNSMSGLVVMEYCDVSHTDCEVLRLEKGEVVERKNQKKEEEKEVFLLDGLVGMQ